MDNQEFARLTKDYVAAVDEHRKYLDQFISSYINGVEVKRATKIITLETSQKLKLLRERSDNLSKKWLQAARKGISKL